MKIGIKRGKLQGDGATAAEYAHLDIVFNVVLIASSGERKRSKREQIRLNEPQPT